MTKCVKPLRHLERLSAKSSCSTNQNAPFGRLSTTCCQVSHWFHALCHIARHVIQRILNPGFLIKVASHDEVSHVCQALTGGGTRFWPGWCRG
jgi:hypothetical protein